MRPNDAVAICIALAIGFLAFGLLGIPYWNSIVRPFIELTGAFINMLSLPTVGIIVALMVGSMIFRMYRP